MCCLACGAGYCAHPVATTRSATAAAKILLGCKIRIPVSTGIISNFFCRVFMSQSGSKRHGFIGENLKEILSRPDKYA
jgi:hypothetical protein